MEPVAQNLQSRLQPTWLLIQAVVRVLVGMSTPSTLLLSDNWNTTFMVPSEEYWAVRIWVWANWKISASFCLSESDRLLISSKERACFCQSHCHTCFARKAGSPASVSFAVISAKVNSRMSIADSLRGVMGVLSGEVFERLPPVGKYGYFLRKKMLMGTPLKSNSSRILFSRKRV